jgi:hypothetical protein
MVLDKETLRLYRKRHPPLASWVAGSNQAQRSLDALGTNRNLKAGATINHFY